MGVKEGPEGVGAIIITRREIFEIEGEFPQKAEISPAMLPDLKTFLTFTFDNGHGMYRITSYDEARQVFGIEKVAD